MKMRNDELYHHGILGQKWGKRNGPPYPLNPGKMSSAEKKQYRDAKKEWKKQSPKKSNVKSMSDSELTSKVKRLNLEKQYEKLSKNGDGQKLDKSKKLVDASSDMVREMKKANKSLPQKTQSKKTLNLSHMTDQQLRDRINRANLERQYNDMFGEKETISKGRYYTDKVLDYGGTALALGSSALAIALAIKELRK